MICLNIHALRGTQLSLLSHDTYTHRRTRAPDLVPHGGQDDLVQQVLVQLFGHLQAGPLHSHGGGQTQDDAQAAEHAEHRQVPDVTEATVLQPQGSQITFTTNYVKNAFTQPGTYVVENIQFLINSTAESPE